MPYFTRESLLAYANRTRTFTETATATRASMAHSSFDIFLSHSSLDTDVANALDELLRTLKYTVYLDRRVDPGLNPKNVNEATVRMLQKRLGQSRCLLVATSDNVATSTWVPWEMGFMDGYRARVATLPVLTTATDTFKGREYFGVYPDVTPDRDPSPTRMLVTHADGLRQDLRDWAASDGRTA